MRNLRLYLVATLLLLSAWAVVTTFVPAPLPAGENIKSYLPTPALTTLSGNITAGVTSITVVDATKLYDATKPAYAFRISIDQEYLYVTSVSGNVLTIGPPPEAPSGTGRGIEGSTAASHSSGANVRAPATAMTWNNAFEMATQIIPVNQHAVLPSNSAATNSANLTTLIASLPTTGVELFFPAGIYNVSSMVDLNPVNQITIRGVGYRGGSDYGSVIVGNFNGSIIGSSGNANQWYHIVNMAVRNNFSGAGTCISLNKTSNAAVECCQVTGFIGINAITGGALPAVDKIKFNGAANQAGSVGLMGCGLVTHSDFVGWDEGTRLWGSSGSVLGCRFETNKKGIRIGVDDSLNAVGLSRATLGGLTFEANDYAISIEGGGTVATTFTGLGMQGSVNAPSGQSLVGVDIAGPLSDSAIINCDPSGNYSVAGFRIRNGNHVRSLIGWSTAINGFGGNSRLWDVASDLAGLDFCSTNYTLRPNDSVGSPSLRRHGNFQYLSQIDHLNPSKEGKNLRAIAVPLGNGVSSLAVAFASDKDAGTSSINTVTATTGGTLPANTYFYTATMTTQHGEGSAQTPKSVVVGGANNAVAVSFFGTTQDGWKRRVYRGKIQFSGTDLASSNGNAANPIVTSASHPFTADDVNGLVNITAGTNFTVDTYQINSAAANGSATLNKPCASAANVSGGTWNLGGTTTGWDGYYELPLNSSTTYNDINAAFDGLKSPSLADSSAMIEPDANYGVWVTPSWGTTCKVTAKATTGFTVSFGTATPDANQTLDWLIVRRLLERSYDGYQVGSRKGLFHQAGLRHEDKEPSYSLAP